MYENGQYISTNGLPTNVTSDCNKMQRTFKLQGNQDNCKASNGYDVPIIVFIEQTVSARFVEVIAKQENTTRTKVDGDVGWGRATCKPHAQSRCALLVCRCKFRKWFPIVAVVLVKKMLVRDLYFKVLT